MEFERCDQQREPTERVGEFALYELLGAGAFVVPRAARTKLPSQRHEAGVCSVRERLFCKVLYKAIVYRALSRRLELRALRIIHIHMNLLIPRPLTAGKR